MIADGQPATNQTLPNLGVDPKDAGNVAAIPPPPPGSTVPGTPSAQVMRRREVLMSVEGWGV